MPAKTRSAIQSILSERMGATVKVEELSTVRGGSINEAARVKTNKGLFFAKWNDSKRFPKMLDLEAKGLELLKNANEIYIPEVIAQDTEDNVQYLVLEYIETSSPGPGTFWTNFGTSLAKLHKHSAEKFGLDHDNYIGSLPQSNRQHETWDQFFILERLQPQLKMAVDSGRMKQSAQFGKLFSKLSALFPREKPSLLHGDLWSGNYLSGPRNQACLIDPAVYYGHREMDIAMTNLFGGFSPGFYEGYMNEFPLERGWEDRRDICNLYPLLVHVNLFGGSYSLQVESILKRF